MSLLKLLLPLSIVVITFLSLAACSPVKLLNSIASAGGGYDLKSVSYGPLDRQMLDIYTPKSPSPNEGWPLVVFFYGGSWNSGDRSDYKFVGAALASHGILAVIADYRLYPEVRYPDFLVDSALALTYGIEHAAALGGDSKRIFVMGHSAGAYNAAMLALDPRWLAATGHLNTELAGWIGLAGPYDFFPTDNPDVQPVFFHPNYPEKAQPIEFGSAQAIPTFLGTGVNDKLVSPSRSTEALATKLRANGTNVRLHMYERASHTTLIGAFSTPLLGIAPVRDNVVNFIQTMPRRQ